MFPIQVKRTIVLTMFLSVLCGFPHDQYLQTPQVYREVILIEHVMFRIEKFTPDFSSVGSLLKASSYSFVDIHSELNLNLS